MYGLRPHHFPLLFGLSLAFLGCPRAAWSKRSRSRPIILGVMNDRVIDVNDQLELTCIGNDTLSWDVPKAAQGQVTKSQCKDNKLPICLKLHLPSSFANQTGHYSCHYAKHGGSRQSAATSVYVFIRDYKNPFMINESKHDMIFFERGQPLIIPCRVSIPDIDVTIELAGGEVKKTRIVWNNQEGFTLLVQSQDYPGLCYCETVINGTVYRSKQYIPEITDKASQNALQLNISDQIYSLVGHSFNLRCSVKDLNRLQRVLSWIYPGSKLHGKEVIEDIGTIHQSTLKVTNATLDYTGQYVCILTYMFVEDGEMKYIKHQVKTSVNVLEKPLILLRSNTTRTIEVLKDKLSVKIKVEMEAYPAPETEWLKDNGVILSKQIRYLQQSQGKTFTLTIHELKREDAGLYVFWARACGNGITVTQNISFYLQVYEPPQVEGGLTVKDITYPLRSKQTLLCSAFGVPMPDIFWQWKPGSCENETGNHLPQSDGWWAQRNSGNVNGAVPNVWLSLEGSENKTLSTMEIYDAQFSGCYRCVSHNYLGNDSFGFAFYVTDVPSGLNIHLRDSGPMRVVEGDPLNLECAANKHLFSTPRWFLRKEVLYTNFTETSQEGDYSLISQLDFAMAQQVHGGVYECEARSRLTGILHRTNFTLVLQSEQFVSLQRNLSDMTVNSGDSLVLRCDVTGSPVPNVTWYKDGQPLNSGKAINIDQGVLRIDRVKEEEAGEYLCIAVNRLGAVESKAVVTVKGTHDQSNLTIVLLCTGVIGILLWLLLVLFIRRIRQPSGADNKTRYLSIIVDPEEVSLNEQCEQLPYDSSKWEFPHDRLKLGKTLGRGAFGRVMEASAFGIDKSSTCKTVAVKMLKEGATSSEYRALMSELKILIHIGHHLNVVNLLGACTKPGGPLMVIVEYCKHGNLSNYLRSKREDFYTCKEKAEVTKVRPINEQRHTQEDDIEEDEEQTKRRKRKKKDYKKRLSSVDSSESSTSSGFAEEHWLSEAEDEEDEDPDKKLLTMEDLICYSFQVAKGMAFLASRKCIHRDLAARNILLAKNNVVKICDFGLARDIYKDPDYVRKGDARLPLKWMAPECIFDKVYTTQCDVWSFGVLLWEIFSLGASPYPGVQIDEEFCHRLKEGIRMKPPEYASPAIYEIMLECWFGNPQDRPTFAMLVDRLGDLLEANVQEDGKDYIPLNTSTVLDDDSGTSFPTSPASCLGEDPHDPKFNYDNTAGIRYCNIGKTALRPVSVKTFDEVPFEPSTPASCEENQTDSGMILASEELKKLEARPKSLIAIGRSLKGCSKSKESLWSESAATHQSSYSPDMAGHTCPFLEEDGASVLGQTNLDYYAGSPPPDYSIAMRYTASPV